MRKTWRQTQEFLNAKYVFPAKQAAVRDLIRCAEAVPEVKRVLVFGGCVTGEYSFDGEVEAYIDGPKINLPCNGQRYLVWYPEMCDGDMMDEILTNGVIVFYR